MTLAKAAQGLLVPDLAIMRRVNRWPAPRWLRYWMILSTRGGDGWLWAALGVAVLASRDPERYAAFGAGALAAALAIVTFKLIKRTVRRKRPCHIEPHCWSMLLPPDQFSFPSGHSMTAFAVAVSVGTFYPAIAAGLLACAACVALSRILLGMHFLSDVVAGAALGTGLGWLACAIVR
jgi:undecaprenyl-diphosphatase